MLVKWYIILVIFKLVCKNDGCEYIMPYVWTTIVFVNQHRCGIFVFQGKCKVGVPKHLGVGGGRDREITISDEQ